MSFLLTLPLVLFAHGDLTHGPWLGHADDDSATVWVRTDRALWLTLEATPLDGSEASHRAFFHTGPAEDYCVSMQLDGLAPGTRYAYSVRAGERVLVEHGEFQTTSPTEDSARLAFCSCVDEDEATRAVWPVIERSAPTALVLLGDTPYIDSTRLAVQRRRYAEFAAVPELARVVRQIPTYSTWDDHDVGRNDTDGNLPGKENARIAFVDFRPNGSFGEGDAGIYTSFRRGPVEVFVLDTRTFANTADTPHSDGVATALGSRQWAWLLRGLERSSAPYKVLCCGMIWNGAVRPGKRDHWGSYAIERSRLFRFIAERKIEGVVLVGGDIHRSRVLHHEFEGVRVHELIVSPLHDRIIKSANQPHPALVADFGKPHSFLLLDARQGVESGLVARLVDETGVPYFERTIFGAAVERGESR